ncbi:MAG: hypothetical protein ACREM8_04005 [Vulcanimicrobiaceae bacterium]
MTESASIYNLGSPNANNLGFGVTADGHGNVIVFNQAGAAAPGTPFGAVFTLGSASFWGGSPSATLAFPANLPPSLYGNPDFDAAGDLFYGSNNAVGVVGAGSTSVTGTLSFGSPHGTVNVGIGP